MSEKEREKKSVKLNGTILESAQCVWCETAEEGKIRVKKKSLQSNFSSSRPHLGMASLTKISSEIGYTA